MESTTVAGSPGGETELTERTTAPSGDGRGPHRFTLTPRDHLAVERLGARRPAEVGQQRGLVGLLFFVAILALVFYFHEQLTVLFWTHLRTSILPVAGILVLLSILGQFVHRRQLARTLAGERSIAFEADGLHHSEAATRSVTPWDAVQYVGQTPEQIYFDFGPGKGVILPKRAFDDPEALDAALEQLRRYCPNVEFYGAPRLTRKRRRWRHAAWAVGLALLALWIAKPWRETAELPDGLDGVSYLTTVTGGADPAAALPMIIDLHPLGGFPEVMLWMAKRRDFPARVVMPAGPGWLVIGNSWYPVHGDYEDMVAETRRNADRLAAFTRAMTARYPTLGRPVVTGFSQGAGMSYALAAYHPELFAAAVPVSGALPGSVPARDGPPPIKVRALHGAEDAVLPPDWAEHTVAEMRQQGWDVSLRIYPEVTHKIGKEMREEWHRLLAGFTAAEADAGR